MNTKKLVNTEKFEINKPSELCQVMFFENYKKGIFAFFNATEIDLINYILYKSREEVVTNKIDLTSIQDLILDLNLKEITQIFKKYENTGYDELIEYFRNLRSKEVVINALEKNKSCDIIYTSILHKVTVSKHRDKKLKFIRLQVDGEIVKMMIHVEKYFSKMHFAIQYSMHSKYSKLLYELLKDYEGIKQLTVDYDLLGGMLNIKNQTRYSNYSYLNGEILKPTLNEINEKSDIQVSYEPIKEKIEGQRKQVTKIKFNIQKQPESRLQELGLIQPVVSIHRFYTKSKTKLDNLVAGGYTVIDEEMWIQTDIQKNEDRYDAEMRIDTWLKETDTENQNMIYMQLASQLPDCEDPTVMIDNYKLIGVFSKDAFTKNPMETITLMNTVISNTQEAHN